MAKKFRITEEQYNQALREGVTLNADVAASNGDIKQAITKAKEEALKNGVDLNKANIQIKASDTNESRIISRQELMSNRIRALKENSQLYTIKDFIGDKKINENNKRERFNELSDEIDYYAEVFNEGKNLSENQIKALKHASKSISVFGNQGQNYHKLAKNILKNFR